MPFWKGKYPKHHLIDPLHWGTLPIMYANSKLSNLAKVNANGTLKHESTSQQFYWFPDYQYCFCIPIHSCVKALFCARVLWWPIYGDAELWYGSKEGVKVPHRGALIYGPFGSYPQRTTFKIRNSGYKLPDKIFLGTWWKTVMGHCYGRRREGAGGVCTSPPTTKRSGCK